MLALVWYFETRDKDERPTRAETSLAWAWLTFRRLVGIAGALLFLGLPVALLILNGVDFRDSSKLVTLLVSSLLGVLCIWVGFFGWNRSVQRDVQIHEQRKRRYGWPF